MFNVNKLRRDLSGAILINRQLKLFFGGVVSGVGRVQKVALFGLTCSK